jgi:O-antigen/teichoic acid export membrane protein
MPKIIGAKKSRNFSQFLRYSYYFAISQILDKILTFLIFGLIVKNYTVLFFSIWTLFNTTSGIVLSISTIGISTYVITKYSSWNQSQKSYVTIVSIGFVLIISLISLLILIPSRNFIAKTIFVDFPSSALLFCLWLFIASECLLDLRVIFWRANMQFQKIANLTISKSFLRLLVVIFIPSLVEKNIESFFILMTSIQLIILTIVVLQFFVSKKTLKFCPSGVFKVLRQNVSKTLYFVIPVVLLNLAYSINNLIDRFVIAHILSFKDLAQYGVYQTLVSPIIVIYLTLNYLLFPKMASVIASGRNFNLSKKLEMYLLLVPYLIILLTIWAPLFLKHVAEDRYPFEPVTFMALSLSSMILGFHLILVSSILIQNMITKALLLVTIGAIVNISFNLALVPQWKILGSVIASLVSNSILAIGALRILKYGFIHSWPFALKYLPRLLILFLVLGVTEIVFRSNSVNPYLLALIQTIIFFAIFVTSDRKLLQEIRLVGRN